MKNVLKILIFILASLVLFLKVEKSTELMLDYEKNEDEITDKIAILTFHRLVPDKIKKEVYPDNQWVGSVDVFESMMKYLYNNGYKTISTEEFYKWYIGEIEYNKKTVLITFDDGFYEDYYLAYPILKKYNLKATSFLVGSRIEDITKKYNERSIGFIGLDVINKVRKEYPNFEFQSHSYNMHYYTADKKHRIRSMTKEEIDLDIERNSQFGFTTMAYPYGDRNELVIHSLMDHNYLVAFRFGPSRYATRKSPQYEIPRIKINGRATLKDMIKWLDE